MLLFLSVHFYWCCVLAYLIDGEFLVMVVRCVSCIVSHFKVCVKSTFYVSKLEQVLVQASASFIVLPQE